MSQDSREIVFHPIGVIRTEHTVAEETPIQPVYAEGCRGRAEVCPEYAEGLSDLNGFSHLYLIYHFDRWPGLKLKVKPFLQDVARGIFSTRSPARPNALGMSLVRLTGIEGNVVHFEGADILDGTPLLDIKPYCAKFDCHPQTRNGWQDEVSHAEAQMKGKRGYRGGRGEGGCAGRGNRPGAGE